MQYRAFQPDIEISGASLMAVFGGFGPLQTIVNRMLRRDGLVDHACTVDDARPVASCIDIDGWYLQQAWLDTMREIDHSFGTEILFNIGAEIPSHAVFPISAIDIHSALESIDVAYHLNHRRAGRRMYDPATQTMLDGIGHYGYDKLSPTHILATCVTPYPCEFDLGIVVTMARRFQPRTIVEHVGNECRRHGAQACTYSLRWG